MSTVNCPRAKSEMTPCVVRDGNFALSNSPGQMCVGCGLDVDGIADELAKIVRIIYAAADEVDEA